MGRIRQFSQIRQQNKANYARKIHISGKHNRRTKHILNVNSKYSLTEYDGLHTCPCYTDVESM